MAVYKIFASADSSIYSRFPAKNTGLDEILEVSVKNNTVDPYNSLAGGTPIIGSDDIRRSLVKFSDSDLVILKGYSTGSWKSYLTLYLADAENLKEDYTLEIRQVSQSWKMGTGKFVDAPEVRNGVNWYDPNQYNVAFNSWINSSSFYLVSGGGSWTNNYATQSFGVSDNKDICANVTNIVTTWFNSTLPNNGFIIKHPAAVENTSGSYVVINYFSNDTHTIYPPTLDIRWDDSVYISGSLSLITNNDFVLTVGNNIGTYKWDSTVYKFRINARDKYPARVFTTSSLYTTNKRLPSSSYWGLQDIKSNDMIVDFDKNYTKISCDGTSSYFNMYMNGLEPDRFYKILIKTELASGEVLDVDNNITFKVVK